ADNRLEDDTGNAITVSLERILQGVRIVVAEKEGVFCRPLRHTGTVRDAEGRGAGAGGDEQAIDMAVIAAGKLDDDVAAGGAAGQSQGAHRRLGAGADHANHLDARHRLDDQFGEVRLALSRGAETGALVQGLLDGPHDPRMTVAEDERAPRTDIIEIAIAVEV